ncbi:hypothetical protein [Streptomyces coeruleorubidus]|uniref:Vegetative cell wall protein gp1 n=1 Tax=Streptomyces coeruleorubidus TaxID=116188 RepID=A0ABZ0KQ25_STRC4|nr:MULTISPECIES: hypothetical protein [Streptomyces]WOT40167.1 hypothetical protein R5U08_00115 [Streptomyces coeruleorubidus]
MTPMLDGLGAKLAEKWLSTVAAPGLFFVGAAASTVVLGHDSALDWHALRRQVRHWATAMSGWSTVGQLTAVALAVLAAVAVGTLARSCATGAERIWTGDWPGPARPLARRLTAHRTRRWRRIGADIQRCRAGAPARGRSAALWQEIDEHTARRDRIAKAEPSRPTHIGDQFAALDARVRHQYGIDLACCWSRLWLVLPDDVRTELRASRARFDAALTLFMWAACYAVLGCFWWPAAVGAAVTVFVSWRRGRRAAELHAELAEAAVDVHLRRLVDELGLGPIDALPAPRIGRAINRIARKAA